MCQYFFEHLSSNNLFLCSLFFIAQRASNVSPLQPFDRPVISNMSNATLLFSSGISSLRIANQLKIKILDKAASSLCRRGKKIFSTNVRRVISAMTGNPLCNSQDSPRPGRNLRSNKQNSKAKYTKQEILWTLYLTRHH